MELRRRLATAAVLGALVAGGCNGSEPERAGDEATTTSEATATTLPTTTTAAAPAPSEVTTTTGAAPAAFAGATTPTSAPPPPGATQVALLADVEASSGAGVDRVVFRFADGHLPGYDVAYVDGPVRQDGSGEMVPVEGRAFLQVRFEPASGVDLRAGTFEETYGGPDRVRGTTTRVTEVVRAGDFEANLTWVIGLDTKVPYRVEVLPGDNAVAIELAARG